MELADVIALLGWYLRCPECFNFMFTAFQCRNGHTICSKCKVMLPSCRSCGDCNISIRNLALERIAERLVFPCKYRSTGCSALLHLSELPFHQKFCRFNAYFCFFLTQRGTPCSFYGPSHLLQAHLKHHHRYFLAAQPLGGCTFFRLLNFQACGRWNLLITAFEELFGCTFITDEEGVYAYVHSLGCGQEASKYKYEILIMDAEEKQSERFFDDVLKFYVDDVEILQRLRCFHTTFDCTDKLMNGERFLMVRVRIITRSPAETEFRFAVPNGRVWNIRGAPNFNTASREKLRPRNGRKYSYVSPHKEEEEIPSFLPTDSADKGTNTSEDNAEITTADCSRPAPLSQLPSGVPSTIGAAAVNNNNNNNNIASGSSVTVSNLSSPTDSACTDYLPIKEENIPAVTCDPALAPATDVADIPQGVKSDMATQDDISKTSIEPLPATASDTECSFSLCSDGCNSAHAAAPAGDEENDHPVQNQNQDGKSSQDAGYSGSFNEPLLPNPESNHSVCSGTSACIHVPDSSFGGGNHCPGCNQEWNVDNSPHNIGPSGSFNEPLLSNMLPAEYVVPECSGASAYVHVPGSPVCRGNHYPDWYQNLNIANWSPLTGALGSFNEPLPANLTQSEFGFSGYPFAYIPVLPSSFWGGNCYADWNQERNLAGLTQHIGPLGSFSQPLLPSVSHSHYSDSSGASSYIRVAASPVYEENRCPHWNQSENIVHWSPQEGPLGSFREPVLPGTPQAASSFSQYFGTSFYGHRTSSSFGRGNYYPCWDQEQNVTMSPSFAMEPDISDSTTGASACPNFLTRDNSEPQSALNNNMLRGYESWTEVSRHENSFPTFPESRQPRSTEKFMVYRRDCLPTEVPMGDYNQFAAPWNRLQSPSYDYKIKDVRGEPFENLHDSSDSEFEMVTHNDCLPSVDETTQGVSPESDAKSNMSQDCKPPSNEIPSPAANNDETYATACCKPAYNKYGKKKKAIKDVPKKPGQSDSLSISNQGLTNGDDGQHEVAEEQANEEQQFEETGAAEPKGNTVRKGKKQKKKAKTCKVIFQFHHL